MNTQKDKVAKFRELHARPGAFIIPNLWDAGSARILQGLGFEALATTSVGFANTLALSDGQVTREQVLEHCRVVCAATDIPVSADLENCFADDPEGVAETIRLAAQSGLAGGSVEDFTGDDANPIYEFNLAVERVHAAAEAARAAESGFVLTARAENLLRGIDDLDDTIRRLQAYEAAGADVLYAPVLTTLDQVRQVTSAVNRPVNVLAPPLKGVSLVDLADAGAKRISVGGALARAAVTALLSAGREMRDHGSFDWSQNLAGSNEVSQLLVGAKT
jgi:2-methylisocitrate lyase-like PEP mutase family enzyme